MAARVSRNNVIAGLFVVGAMVLALFISIMVSGAQKRLASTHPYTVRFSLADGASGLKPGSPVMVGGQEAGRVVGISFAIPTSGDAKAGGVGGIDVRVDVRWDITLHEDAVASLERPLLGSMSAINFPSVGGAKPVLAPGSTLVGVVAPPSFLAQAGYGPEQVDQVKKIIADSGKAIESLNRIVQRIEGDIDPDLKSMREAIEDIKTIAGDFRGRSKDWVAQVDSILTNADVAVKDFKAVVQENQGPLKQAVANLDSALFEFKNQTMPDVNQAVKSAGQGADEFRESNARLGRLLKEEEPNIQRILANLRLASDEIKLLGVEARSSPWKLLYAPKTKELESEMFYDAARTYAQAVSDLRAASEALRAVSADSTAKADVDRLQARLQEAFKAYEEAERGLLKKMADK